jgi:uncharacterized protein
MTVIEVEDHRPVGDGGRDLAAPDLGRAIGILRDGSDALRRLGVSRLAIFGSVARGTAGPGSDIDLMLDIDPDAGLDVFDYAWIAHEIRRMMPSWPVDIALRVGMPPEILRGAERDAVRVF